MTLESLLGAMNERKVAKDIIVDPKPAISRLLHAGGALEPVAARHPRRLCHGAGLGPNAGGATGSNQSAAWSSTLRSS